jgi:hypothetical protein
MSDKKKQCPESFISAGAASVVLRHAMMDLKPHFDALHAALDDAKPDMQKLGIARMEIAPGEILLAEAAMASLKVMAAHDVWRAMLDRHGIATPTDAEILAHHKKQGIAAADGSSLKAATTLGNYR